MVLTFSKNKVPLPDWVPPAPKNSSTPNTLMERELWIGYVTDVWEEENLFYAELKMVRSGEEWEDGFPIPKEHPVLKRGDEIALWKWRPYMAADFVVWQAKLYVKPKKLSEQIKEKIRGFEYD